MYSFLFVSTTKAACDPVLYVFSSAVAYWVCSLGKRIKNMVSAKGWLFILSLFYFIALLNRASLGDTQRFAVHPPFCWATTWLGRTTEVLMVWFEWPTNANITAPMREHWLLKFLFVPELQDKFSKFISETSTDFFLLYIFKNCFFVSNVNWFKIASNKEKLTLLPHAGSLCCLLFCRLRLITLDGQASWPPPSYPVSAGGQRVKSLLCYDLWNRSSTQK